MKAKSKLTIFARGVGAITVANILTKAATFFLLPLYTAHISPSQMGIYETIIGFIGFVLPLLVMALDSGFSAFYFDVDTEEHKQRVLSTTTGTLFISSFFLLALIPITPTLSYFIFGTKEYALAIVFALTGAAISMWHLPFALSLRMNNRLTLYAVISFTGSLISMGSNVYLILVRHMGINALLISGLFMNVLLFALYYSFSGVSFKKNSFDISLLKRMLAYSLPLLPLLIVNWIMAASDRFILLKYSGSAETGIYGIADKFPTVLSLLTNGISISYSAFAFSSVKDENAKSQFISIQALTHIVLVAITVIVASVSKEIVGFMIDPAYMSASKLLGPLLLGQVCHISSVIIAYAFAFVRKSYLNLIPVVIGTIINLGLNLIFIPRYGSYAAALTTLTGYFCILLLTYYLAKRHFECKYLIGRTVLTVILAFVGIVVMEGKPVAFRLLSGLVVLCLITVAYYKPVVEIFKKVGNNEAAVS